VHAKYLEAVDLSVARLTIVIGKGANTYGNTAAKEELVATAGIIIQCYTYTQRGATKN
jgi:hypothetical protein